MQVLWLMIQCTVSSQDSALVAVRVEDGPTIDGRLDAAWTEARTVHCTLTQFDPDHGMPMTEETENFNRAPGARDTRSTDWRSLIVRAGYMFHPELNLRLFSQYSRFATDWGRTGESESSSITANLLLSWQYLPGSMFYLLVENGFEEEEDGGFGTPDLGLYAKLTWFLPL